jgi:hypothetical protein|tara:strand:- start:718 stop:846 length:129 start_codon:yes stop_codon:yes gene_type:complete
MRYFFGVSMLYSIGYFGGDVLTSSIWIGAAYGFIDHMKERSI